LLIDAWIKGGIRSKLFIVGSQEVEFKLILARYSAIPDSVIFVESFTSEDLKRLSRKFNLVGMLNSLSEGYSRVVNEYLALGLPVILSEVNSRPNMDNISGYIVNSFDIQGIINAVDQLKNAIKYNEFRKNCMSRPVRTYQDFASTYVQIIQSIR
jgi:glycosyltransferase involved in cell wall biosynthesis